MGKSDAWSPSVLRDKFDSCRLKGGTNRLNRFGLEAIALFQTGNCLRCDLCYFGKFTHSPAKSYPRHSALDGLYFITW